jgi:hypothetical protein
MRFLRSAVKSSSNANNGFSPSLRNILFRRQNQASGTLHTKVIDLASINNLRFRSFGEATFCQVWSNLEGEQVDRESVTWASLKLNPVLEPTIRSLWCHPCDVDAYVVLLSQRLSNFDVDQKHGSREGQFPTENTLAMKHFGDLLTFSRAHFGWFDIYWTYRRAKQPKYQDSVRFFSSISNLGFFGWQGFFSITMPPEEKRCLPREYLWHACEGFENTTQMQCNPDITGY